ncbi:predicted protein [Chaetoceros tenuissimus]|uniref:Uncharacterized protein n=1 Tax=Chaetoceros tenuissimus TaxID=426638 RepID=A0AAD3CXI3_9STRA|nr:predicted protein [Chaetoceros tenuissimus]
MVKPQRKDFKQYTFDDVELPQSLDSPIESAVMLAEFEKIKAGWPQDEDKGYSLVVSQERIQEIFDNNQFIIRNPTREKYSTIMNSAGKVLLIRIVEDFTGAKLKWVQYDSSHNWMSFDSMLDALSQLGFDAITNDQQWHYFRDKLCRSQPIALTHATPYPIIKHPDGRKYAVKVANCVKVAGIETVTLPIITEELVEIVQIRDLNNKLLKIAKTRWEAVNFMNEMSGNAYNPKDLKQKLMQKWIDARRPGREGSDMEKPFPSSRSAKGNMQFILIKLPHPNFDLNPSPKKATAKKATAKKATAKKVTAKKATGKKATAKKATAKKVTAKKATAKKAKPDPVVLDSKPSPKKATAKKAKPDPVVLDSKPSPKKATAKKAKPDPVVLDSKPSPKKATAKKATAKTANPSPQPLAESNVNTSTTKFHPIFGKVKPDAKDVSKMKPTAKKAKKEPKDLLHFFGVKKP